MEMTSSPSTIDRLPGPANRPAGPWLSAGLGGAALALIYLADVNRNILYLSMLLSVVILISAALRRRWAAFLGLGACAYLACVPAQVVDLGVLYPAPRNIPGAEKMWVTEIGDGARWTYKFALGDQGRNGECAKRSGYLYVDGRNLSGLEIEMQGRTLNASAYCGKKSGIDHVAIPVRIGSESVVAVTLSGDPRSRVRIFHGPEAHGFDVYGDAVWLEFTGDGDRLIFHAKRTVDKPEMSR